MYAHGLTLSETARRNQAWSPARLFGSNDRGMLLAMMPGLLSQDSSGATAVTGPGQPVGLVRRAAGTVDAAQAVSAARPTLGRHPRSGRRNLLTRSEDLSHGAWAKQGSTALSEMQVRDTAASSSHLLRRVTNFMAAGTYTVSFECKAIGPVIACTLLVAYSVGTGSWHINLLTGVASQAATVIPSTCTVTPTGNGWFRVVFTFMAAEPVSYWDIRFSEVWPVLASSGQSYLGDGTGGMDFRGGFQMEAGASATPYQKVDTDLDVTEAGVPDAWYLSLDGIDDAMSTTAITWGADEMTVIAAVCKNSDGGNQVIAEFSSNVDTNPGSFFMLNVSGAPGYRGRSKGTTHSDAEVGTGWPAGSAHVVTFEGKIGSDTSRLRVNGAQRATNAADQGAGNFGIYPLYIGARAGTGFPLSGRIYGLLAINRLLNATELALAERWMAAKCGVTL